MTQQSNGYKALSSVPWEPNSIYAYTLVRNQGYEWIERHATPSGPIEALFLFDMFLGVATEPVLGKDAEDGKPYVLEEILGKGMIDVRRPTAKETIILASKHDGRLRLHYRCGGGTEAIVLKH